ncbi:MAG: ABC transporter permease [Candidatus Eremiobacteraeota bacterium]|nr:ABC transporter permease [Candidatus Eremiobacteraeota bacterium]
MNALLIASLVLREASRRRLLLTVALLTLGLVLLTGWGFHKLATLRDGHGHGIPHVELMVASSVLIIMMAFMFSIILCVGAAFLGALSTGSEIENGTLLAIVPRPIARNEIIIGKWIGNASLLAAYATLIAGSEFLVVGSTTGYVPPHPAVAIAFLIAQCLLVLTVTMTLSVRLSAIAAGFTTIVLFGLAWIVGVAGVIGSALHNTALHQAALIVSLIIPTDGMWRAAVFALEPAAMAALGSPGQGASNPFVTAAPPTQAYFVWCAGWWIAILAIGMLLFRRRDI